MADVGNLIAKLTLDTAGFEKEAGGIEGQISKLAGSIGNVLGGVTAAVGAAVGAAAAGVTSLVKESVSSFAEYEQLVGGAQKIFDQMDYEQIANDAAEAYKTMNISASQYLSMINDVGASFSATMGDQQGYEAAKQGMQAIADYASGTGKSVDVLTEKFAAITRSAGSYQSIADQFSGILPATSADFLSQAQAAGLLSQSYKQLTDVPVAEYQQAVSAMLEQGVEKLGLAGNTVNETTNTISGSIAGLKAAWSNMITEMADSTAYLPGAIEQVVEMARAVIANLLPVVSQALQGVARLIQELAPIIAQELPPLISEVVPLLLEAAVSIVDALTQALPQLIESIMTTIQDILPQVSSTIVSLLETLVGTVIPALISLAGQLVLQLGTALLDNIDELSAAALSLIMGLIDFMTEALPMLITIAVQIVSSLATFIAENAEMVISGIIALVMAIIQALMDNIPTLLEAGVIIIKGLVDGLLSNRPLISDSVVILITTMVSTIIENLPMVLAAAIEIGLKIVAGIVAAIPNLIISLGKMLGIIDDTQSQVKTHSTSMQSSVNMSATGINSDINGMIDNLNSKTNSAKDTLKSTSTYTGTVKDEMNKKADDLEKTAAKVQQTTIVSYKNIEAVVSLARASLQSSFATMEEMIQGLIIKFEELGAVNASPKVDASGVEKGCTAIIAAVEKAIEALNRLGNASSGGGGGGGFGGGHASGGWMEAGTTYLVGELGPELITPTRSGYVHTAEETADILGDGDGRSIVININGDVYDDQWSMRNKMRTAILDVIETELAYG